ncbi:hypothetical protein [Embleya sp. MST-111070]|uniref:hypothetical protein n=1 Tax=Embleya sp. MST-111070 TaxID=3398231 RepID=UPI003F73663F
MSQMLGKTLPGNRGLCRRRRVRCTCGYYFGDLSRTAKRLRRRRARKIERRTWQVQDRRRDQ